MAGDAGENAPWEGDLLDRKAEGEFITRFLLGRIKERGQAGRPRSYVLNVDADWGRGKTFFLDGLATYLRSQGHPVATVNAWRDDFATDPLMPVMAAIEDAMKEFLKKPEERSLMQKMKGNGLRVAAAMSKGLLNTALQKTVGMTAESIAGTLSAREDQTEPAGEPTANATAKAIVATAESAVAAAYKEIETIIDEVAAAEVEKFRAARRAIDDFGASLEALLRGAASESAPMPLFILVDELDRCRPDYAVSLLERVKHLFAINDVVFIFATNAEQLGHAVRAVYGSGFDGEHYLHRFFDRRYRLLSPSPQGFVERELSEITADQLTLISVPPNCTLPGYATHVINLFDVGPRGIEQCLDLLRTIVSSWAQPAKIELCVLLPMIVGMAKGERPSFSRGFADRLKSLAKENGVAEPMISFRRRSRDRSSYSGHSEQEVVNAHTVFEELVNAVGNVPAILREDHDRQLMGWIAERLEHELRARKLADSMFQRDTILKVYPAIIDTAGRLAAADA